jgi:hypothetical protein
MKKILFAMLFISCIANAQETEFTFNNERGMTDYLVIPMEGKTDAEIYNKVIDWIKVTYKNPDKVILSKIENEYVRFEGFSETMYALHLPLVGKEYQNTKYEIEISVKNGKYKFDLISMQNYTKPSQYAAGGWNSNGIFNGNMPQENMKMFYKKDGTIKAMWKYLPLVPEYLNNLNKSLSESIISNVKKSDGW